MKFHVRGEPFFLLATIFVIVSAITAHGQVKCVCADPPGGSVTCEQNQIAKCSVREGHVFGSCSKVSRDLEGDEFWTAVLHEVTGDRVKPADVRQEKYKMILREHKYVDEDGNVTYFSLPKDAPDLPDWAKEPLDLWWQKPKTKESGTPPSDSQQKPKKPLPVPPLKPPLPR